MSGEDEQQEQTIAEDLVVTKYKMGGDIANRECGLRVRAPRLGGRAKGDGDGLAPEGWSGGVTQRGLVRAQLRSAGGGVVGRLRVAPGTREAGPGLESLEMLADGRQGGWEKSRAGPLASSDPRALVRRRGVPSATHASVHIFCL